MKHDIKPLTENNGTVYPIPSCIGDYVLPRTEFLLHEVKAIERQLIWWYQDNKYSQGDSYSVSITNKGKWKVRHSNDYPMQHGEGRSHILTEEEYQAAMKITKIIK